MPAQTPPTAQRTRPLCDPYLSRPVATAGLLRPRVALFVLFVLALLLLPLALKGLP